MTAPSPSISVRVLWGQRPTTLEDCTLRTERTLALLQSCSPAFYRWGRTARTLKKAMKPLPLRNREDVAELVASGVQRGDVPPRSAMPNLGYSIWLWNRCAEGVSATLHIQDGSIVPGVPNLVRVEASRQTDGAPVTGEAFLSVLRGLADIWVPDEGDLKLEAPRSTLFGIERKRVARVLARWPRRIVPLAGVASGDVRVTWAGRPVLRDLSI